MCGLVFAHTTNVFTQVACGVFDNDSPVSYPRFTKNASFRDLGD